MIKALLDRVLPKRSPKKQVASGKALGIRPEQMSRNAVYVCQKLKDAGFDAFIVGGAVRDALLGVVPKDFDVATSARPEQVKNVFRRAFIIGRRFRLVHVMFGDETIEVSTFRSNAVTGAKGSGGVEADSTGRITSDNVYGSQIDDAVRRDFTVNALYYDPTTDEVVDFLGGLKDIEKRSLRLIGEAETRYREDPVRMLRAVRLSVKLGCTIARATAAPIKKHAALIQNVPAARLFDEIQKLLLSGYASATLADLRKHGLSNGLLPLLDLIYEQPGGQKFIELALDNTDRRVREDKPVSPAFLFASLLWHEVLKRWNELQSRGEHRIPALLQAMEEVLDEQRETITLPQRFAGITREIWLMQPRFEQRTSRAALRVVEQPRFRAAYDFLLLRAAAGEIEQELADWWTNFIESDPDIRQELINQRLRAQQRGPRGNGNGGGGRFSPGRPESRERSDSAPVAADAEAETTPSEGAGDSDGAKRRRRRGGRNRNKRDASQDLALATGETQGDHESR
ncbi:MAG: polynucleotide adenylyltransferase PcnB [Betaproteobacteria bacterium]|nr:MAG: polynucleotide adenylyltransferase PcnB [Betaproteobacteria bacterium]TAG47735.1 MAG: polynucleotide adenylyltransferase PcnB [Betaproteobacteria bacterium]